MTGCDSLNHILFQQNVMSFLVNPVFKNIISKVSMAITDTLRGVIRSTDTPWHACMGVNFTPHFNSETKNCNSPPCASYMNIIGNL